MGKLEIKTRLFGYDKKSVETYIKRLSDENEKKMKKLKEELNDEYKKKLEKSRNEIDREWSERLANIRMDVENEYLAKMGELRAEKNEEAQESAEKIKRIRREYEEAEERLRFEIRSLTEERAVLLSKRETVANAMINAQDYAEELKRKADENARVLYAESREAYRRQEERLAGSKAKVDGLVELMEQIITRSKDALASMSDDMENMGEELREEKKSASSILLDAKPENDDEDAVGVEETDGEENTEAAEIVADNIIPYTEIVEKKAAEETAMRDEEKHYDEPAESKFADSAAFISGVIENQWLRVGRD